MNYKDYVGLKLQNFSKADFENLNQMNFASDTTGYMQRVTKDLEPKKVNKPVNPNRPKPPSANQQTSSSANKSTTNTQSNQQTSNNQATTSPSKSQNNTNTQTNSNSNQQTKNTQTNTTSNPPTEKKTVKNWYGSNVDFEKRDGKWYRSGTNEEVSKTGKWKSYFDEKSGVKNVRNTSGKSTAPNGKVGVGPIEIENTPTNEKPEKATESTVKSKRRFDVLGNAVAVSDKEAEAHNKVNPTKLMTDQERSNLAKKSNTQSKQTQATQSNVQDKKYDKNGKPILDISNQHANYSKYDKKYLDMLLKEGRLDKAEYDRIMKFKNQMEPVYRINLAH